MTQEPAQTARTWFNVFSAVEEGTVVSRRFEGLSMMPLILPGTVVHARRSRRRPDSGQVVVAFARGNLIAHRVKEVSSTVVVKGDTSSPAEAIDHDQILGPVVAIERFGMVLSLERGIGAALDRLAAFASPASERMLGLVLSARSALRAL